MLTYAKGSFCKFVMYMGGAMISFKPVKWPVPSMRVSWRYPDHFTGSQFFGMDCSLLLFGNCCRTGLAKGHTS